MDIQDLKRKEIEDNKKNVLIFNPLNTDFQGKWDGKELPEYLIPSQENKKFPTYLANHFGKHLMDAYKATKDKNYTLDKARKLVFCD